MQTKKSLLKTSLLLVTILILVLEGCKWPENKQDSVPITGSFIDTGGKKITDGKIIIYASNADGKESEKIELDINEGRIDASVPKAKKYIVNVKVRGYGLVSKVFYNSIPTERTYELKEATVTPLNPSTGGIVSDTKNNCSGSWSARANWTANPMKSLPLRINSNGQVAGFGMGTQLQQAYDFHSKAIPCNNKGITVTIPANALNASASSVNVSMSAVDLFSPDGMPGEYAVRRGQQVGFMESFGAFSLEIYDDERNYNLNEKKESEAIVTFPLNMITKDSSLSIPESVPLLYYDEATGEWKKEGDARYDKERKAYVASVIHFSAINLDLEKFNTACLRFKDDISDAINPTFRVEVTAPPTTLGGNPRVSFRDVTAADMNCAAPDDNQFALTRLPSDTEVSIVFFNTAATPDPYGVYVFKTGPTDTDLNDPARPGCGELNKCGNFKVFTQADFGVQEIYIAACRDAATSNIIVSLALGPTVVASFDPNDYNIKISRSEGGSPDCTKDFALTSPTIVSPPTAEVKIFQYKIAFADLCGSGAYATETVQLFDKTATPVAVSNSFIIVPCN